MLSYCRPTSAYVIVDVTASVIVLSSYIIVDVTVGVIVLPSYVYLRHCWHHCTKVLHLDVLCTAHVVLHIDVLRNAPNVLRLPPMTSCVLLYYNPVFCILRTVAVHRVVLCPAAYLVAF